jgi:DNA-binding NarL/FixJ family response regulator
MVCVYLADANAIERSALRLMINDLNMDVVGEASDWPTVLVQVSLSHPHMLVVDWDLLPGLPGVALEELRKLCPASMVIVLISHLDARQQAALSAGADVFISRGDAIERVVDRLQTVARRFHA